MIYFRLKTAPRWKKGIEALKDYDRLECRGERSREHLRGSS